MPPDRTARKGLSKAQKASADAHNARMLADEPRIDFEIDGSKSWFTTATKTLVMTFKSDDMDLFDRLKEARAKQDPAIEEYERLYGDVPIRGRNLRFPNTTSSSTIKIDQATPSIRDDTGCGFTEEDEEVKAEKGRHQEELHRIIDEARKEIEQIQQEHLRRRGKKVTDEDILRRRVENEFNPKAPHNQKKKKA